MEFSGNVEQIFGVWKHIRSHTPSPESDEVAQIIGRRVINENSNLWIELSALKTIVFEMTGSTASIEGIGRRTNSSFTGKKAIQAARNFSQLHYNEEEEQLLGAQSNCLDAVYSRSVFTIDGEDSVSIILDELLNAFSEEREALEAAIEKMNRALDGDLDSVLFPTPDCSSTNNSNNKISSVGERSAPLQSVNSADIDQPSALRKNNKAAIRDAAICAFCHVVLSDHQNGTSNKFSNGATINGSGRSRQLQLCTSCRMKKDKKEAKAARSNECSMKYSRTLPERLRANVQNVDFAELNEAGDDSFGYKTMREGDLRSNEGRGRAATAHRNNNEESPNGSSSACASPRSGPGSSSRFRDRLNSARSELHFLDDF